MTTLEDKLATDLSQHDANCDLREKLSDVCTCAKAGQDGGELDDSTLHEILIEQIEKQARISANESEFAEAVAICAMREVSRRCALTRQERGAVYRHKKRGTTYAVIGEAELQAGRHIRGGELLTVYRGEDGKLWARLSSEFHDGRFEPLSTPSAQESP